MAIVLNKPESLALSRLQLTEPQDGDVIVDIQWSGISTGTERLLYTGKMPPFPGMGYPLVPGYESVGTIVEAGAQSGRCVGETVFVPGANCFGDVRGLFGGAAARLVVPGSRVLPVQSALGDNAVLLALAATAHHAMAAGSTPDLIIGHGVLGRLLARMTVYAGGEPTVWETNPTRQPGGEGYRVVSPDDDDRRDYSCICDVSGDAGLLDSLIGRLQHGGTIVLAGFYHDRLSFAFPPAFMKEARLRIAAEWKPDDLKAVMAMIEADGLSLDGLITHRAPAGAADHAYRTAFDDPACLKMILDWSVPHDAA